MPTGSRPARPPFEADENAAIVHAADVLKGRATAGARVVIYDWLTDWIGVGLAERFAREGRRVRLCVNGPMAAAAIQNYVRDHNSGVLFELGVEVIPYHAALRRRRRDRLFPAHGGAQAGGHRGRRHDRARLPERASRRSFASDAEALGIPHHLIGDCLAARTCEEAVYEGLKVAAADRGLDRIPNGAAQGPPRVSSN